ncbi:MAG: hypothetical protein AAGJ83_00755 [Planctomycetota bacterium]
MKFTTILFFAGLVLLQPSLLLPSAMVEILADLMVAPFNKASATSLRIQGWASVIGAFLMVVALHQSVRRYEPRFRWKATAVALYAAVVCFALSRFGEMETLRAFGHAELVEPRYLLQSLFPARCLGGLGTLFSLTAGMLFVFPGESEQPDLALDNVPRVGKVTAAFATVLLVGGSWGMTQGISEFIEVAKVPDVIVDVALLRVIASSMLNAWLEIVALFTIASMFLGIGVVNVMRLRKNASPQSEV